MSASVVAAWWGAGTGTGSLILLAARFIWDRGADTRATQKELRGEIRLVLHQIDELYESGKTALRSGKDVGDPPQPLKDGPDLLPKYEGRLTRPDPQWLRVVWMQAIGVRQAWAAVHRHEEDVRRNQFEAPERTQELARRLHASQTEMREELDAAQKQLKDVLVQFDNIDKGR